MKLFKAKLLFYTVVSALAIFAGFISYIEVNDVNMVSVVDEFTDRIVYGEDSNNIMDAIIAKNDPEAKAVTSAETEIAAFSRNTETQSSVRSMPEQEAPEPISTPTPTPYPTATPTPTPTSTPTVTACPHQWAYSPNGDGTHSVACIVCGAEPFPRIEECELNEDYRCVKCSYQHVHTLELQKDGTHTFLCECGYSEQGEHNFEVRYSDNVGHILICECGEIRSEHHNFDTNFVQKICKDCGYVYQRYVVEDMSKKMYTHEYVNQRKYPTTSSDKLGHYEIGTALDIVGYVSSFDDNPDEQWYLTSNGDYVYAKYLKDKAPTATPTPTPTNTPTPTPKPKPKPTNTPKPTQKPSAPTPTPDLRGGLGDMAIDKILKSSDYQFQSTAVYTSGGKKQTMGLCDLCSATNLLNRKLARDGGYSSSHKFEIYDVIAEVNGIKRSSITYLGKGGTYGKNPQYSYSFHPYFRENITFTTKDSKSKYTMQSVYVYNNSGNTNMNYIKELLSKHPEGVMIRAGYEPGKSNGFAHALVITYCDKDGQFYAIDTGSDQVYYNNRWNTVQFGTATVKLEDTWLCRQGKEKKGKNYNVFACIWAITYIDH